MRIGCLGAANIAAAALIDPSKVRGGAVLQAIAARDPARARLFAERHGFVRIADDYEALVTAPDIDLVYNALPINLHAEWSIRALEAGKHVLCEKPFAMNSEEAKAVLAAAETSGKRVIEAFHYRYHPGFRQMIDWIQTGKIGSISTIIANFHIGIPFTGSTQIRHMPETGGGAFMDLGCYPLSWALTIMGIAPSRVTAEATLTPRGVDEALRAILVFDGGARAELSACMTVGEPFSANLTVTGSRGEIRFVNPLAPHGGASLSVDTGEHVHTVPLSRISTYTYQLDSVLEALESCEPLPTEGEAVLRQQCTLDAIYEAAGLQHLRFRTAA
jgi:predicted dehydrogenase